MAFSCKVAVLPAVWRSAHLINPVFPDVPVRQWVLSLPHRLWYLLAWDHLLRRAESCDTSACPRKYPKRGGQGRRRGDLSRLKIGPVSVPNSMLPGEGIASARRVSARRVVPVPDGYFSFVFPPIWR